MRAIVIKSVENIKPGEIERFFDELTEVEKNAWPPQLQASREKFIARFETFPEGFFVARVAGRIKGFTTSQINHCPSEFLTWDEITDRGFIKKTHNPTGNALYVVSLGVTKDMQGKGLGSLLLEAQKQLAMKLGLRYLFLGARIPGYDKYCKTNGETSIEDYLKIKNENSESIDPEVRFYERKGLKIVKIVPNFEPDPESRNYGVVMVWETPKK